MVTASLIKLVLRLGLSSGLLLFASFLFPAERVVIEEIYYLIEDEIITKMDYEAAYRDYESSLQEALSEEQIRQNLISNLILEKMVAHEAKQRNLQVSGLDVSNQIKKIMLRNQVPDWQTFVYSLSLQGVDFSKFFERIRNQLLFKLYLERVVNPGPLAETEIKSYYEKNKEKEFKITYPLYRFSLLLLKIDSSLSFSERLKVQRRLKQVRARLLNRELSFSQAVRLYSEDPLSKLADGDLGWIDLNREANSGLQVEVLSALKKNEISSLVFNQLGIAIYKLTDKLTEGYVPFSLASVAIREKLLTEKREKIFSATLKESLEKIYVKKLVDF